VHTSRRQLFGKSWVMECERKTYENCTDRRISVNLRREPRSSLSRRHILALHPHNARSVVLARATGRVDQGGKIGGGWTFRFRLGVCVEERLNKASFCEHPREAVGPYIYHDIVIQDQNC
jgi:hypothetical protein